ncbi:septum formation inhibitor Maf [Hydrogenimonas cancrithermarum]|uniref:Nucleoside triphosphate pyrophosphatase n=1 Tax=Hydrogenimonas cancrithermarum TaxID=2993563 RepID=A0ABN6WW46_9BACT|nr:septum formation inhibitor Maf [Hydrogenimonas cancrithermarum]BDY13330.1 Maf-like protein [Hydrogenimonas cancrithermarum]
MILLGSSSQTRAKILESRGIAFKQVGCDFDEEALEQTVPKNFVYHAAMGKMKACESRFGLETPILCADTVVTAHGEILRKARDEADARRILMMQSGSDVSIITCMVYKSEKKMFIDLSATVYTFAPFDEADLNRYIESGEWRGKAGACMVEGFCKSYIQSVRGYESCAMGLTIEKLEPWLDV